MRKMRGIASWAAQTSRATSPTMPQTKYTTSPTSYSRPQQPPSQPHSRPRASMDGSARHTRDRSRGIDPSNVPRPPSRQRANSNARPPPTRSRTYSYTVQHQQGAVIPGQVFQTAVVAPQPRRQNTVPGYGTAPNTHVVTYDPRRPVVLNPQPGAQYEIVQVRLNRFHRRSLLLTDDPSFLSTVSICPSCAGRRHAYAASTPVTQAPLHDVETGVSLRVHPTGKHCAATPFCDASTPPLA